MINVKLVLGTNQRRIYQWGATGAPSPTPPNGVQHSLEENIGIIHIWVVNTTYYIETIDYRIHKKIFKHHYGRSPYNIPVALFLIFAWNTSTVRTNWTNKRSTQNAQEMGFQGFRFQKFSRGVCPQTPIAMHPLPENLHPLYNKSASQIPLIQIL
jgi:hypothetical protein